MKNWDDLDDNFDDEQSYSSFDDNNWIIKVNNIIESSWERKIDAIESIIDIININLDEDLSKELKNSIENISEIDDNIENVDDLRDYLYNVDSTKFHKILNKIIKNLDIKLLNIRLINNDGEDIDFEEL